MWGFGTENGHTWTCSPELANEKQKEKQILRTSREDSPRQKQIKILETRLRPKKAEKTKIEIRKDRKIEQIRKDKEKRWDPRLAPNKSSIDNPDKGRLQEEKMIIYYIKIKIKMAKIE